MLRIIRCLPSGRFRPFKVPGLSALESKGHEVVCAFPEQFLNLADDAGIRCQALTKEFIELIGSQEGQLAMGGNVSFLQKINFYYRLYKNSTKVPVRDLPHIGFNRSFGALFNRVAYGLANYGLVKHALSTTRKLRGEIGVASSRVKPAILRQKMIYTVSPALFPRRRIWPFSRRT